VGSKLIKQRNDVARILRHEKIRTQRASELPHDSRCGHIMAFDITYDEGEPAFGKIDNVVEIAPDFRFLASGYVPGRHTHAGQVAQMIWQQAGLQEMRDVRLFVELPGALNDRSDL
jgi:hypothetical protein